MCRKGKALSVYLKPYGEIVCRPFEMQHVEKDLEAFHNLLQKLDGEIRIVMEATGIYHLPILIFFIIRDISYLLSIRLQ